MIGRLRLLKRGPKLTFPLRFRMWRDLEPMYSIKTVVELQLFGQSLPT